MKRKIISLILLCALMTFSGSGLALGAGYGTAIIDGQNADRVHLRAWASASASSLGLYFTGTEVELKSDPDEAWVKVTIGSQTGYMNSDYLYQGNNPGSVRSKQPTAMVSNIKAGSWVNLRGEPSLRAAVAGKIYKGDTVTVLGETAGNWYYIEADGLYGYVMSGYLTTGGSSPSKPDSYGTAVIDGGNSDRVHLRKLPSAGANSLGLYFTGTKVLCKSDPGKDWVKVTVGSQTGYINSEYLYVGNDADSVQPEQPEAAVKNIKAGSWVNLRSQPSLSGAAAGKLYKGDVVTVLGQTSGGWYYVKADDQYGYIMSAYLSIGGSV